MLLSERGMVFFYEGLIDLSVAESPELESMFTKIIVNNMMRDMYAKNFVKQWATPAIAAFQKSLQLSSDFSGATHYNMGRAYLLMGDKVSAQSAYTKAQQGDDTEVTIEAAKAISRMNEKKSRCFVATACYGDFNHPDVMTFRQWRDTSLLNSVLGRLFVETYYTVSPPLANYIGKHPRLASIIRTRLLAPFADKLSANRKQ